MTIDLSLGLAAFVKNADIDDAGADAVELAKRVIVDTVAVILSGAGSDVAGPMLDYVSRMGQGAVPLIGTDAAANAPAAALVGGTFGAALDFDDVLSM
ncbi:MAG: MmgE/PrpD family protein, partial [Shinella sp.]